MRSGDLFPFTREGDPERSEQRSISQAGTSAARRAANCSISDSSSTANVEQTKTVVKRRGEGGGWRVRGGGGKERGHYGDEAREVLPVFLHALC